MGIVSICSTVTMDSEDEIEMNWGREVKQQVESLFEKEKRVLVDETTGLVRHTLISPMYKLMNSSSGLPRLLMGTTLIWSDDQDEQQESNDQKKDHTFFTYVQLNVKNDGKTPLHLYQLTLVERNDGQDSAEKINAFVLPLVAPAVVQPGDHARVSFKAITRAAVDPLKSYMLYISHNGFRSHVFEGVLDGKRFMAREEAVQPHDEDNLYDLVSLSLATNQSILSSFPFTTWQIGSCAVALALGLAVALYIRRNRNSIHLVERVVTRCLWRSQKMSAHRSAKPVSTRVATSRATISKRGEDHVEMESLIQNAVASNAPNTPENPAPEPDLTMPAFAMKQHAFVYQTDDPATKKALPETLKVMATNKLVLDLDHAVSLHSNRFESMWDEYVERFRYEWTNTGKHLDSEMLLVEMKVHGILCIASGAVDGVKKYVFYAKQRDKSWFFLATIAITAVTGNALITLKTGSDVAEELVLQLAELLKTTMTRSVVATEKKVGTC
ncbi:unnamed protein product [Peronospora belbahrii]|uniref:Beta-adaptin appendage C-terminal subdomain domain-containing protein n=1 Tax=Peronospora belbahrii TaxID=622444 RepID=A0ABN8CYX4_9STRA|nr:unnamed protein product [Peronospora belbahrii]